MKRLILVSLAFALALSARPSGQAPDQGGVTFRSTSQTVAIYATVTDSTGRLVPDLQERHFEVFDNLKSQPLTLFKSDIQPITVIVMLDTSGSMTFNLELLKQAAEAFVLRLLPDDKARIGNFDDKIVLSPVFTHDRDSLVRYLHEGIDYGNGTKLWDAVDTAMTGLSKEQSRRVVLAFTDGDDTTSRRATLDTVLRRAQSEEYMVYAIGLHSHILGQTTRPDRGLKRLAEETGGGYFELTNTADLNSTFTRVADELHRQYVLGFSPAVLDSKLHKLDVRVTKPGLTARARRSYMATKGGG